MNHFDRKYAEYHASISEEVPLALPSCIGQIVADYAIDTKDEYFRLMFNAFPVKPIKTPFLDHNPQNDLYLWIYIDLHDGRGRMRFFTNKSFIAQYMALYYFDSYDDLLAIGNDDFADNINLPRGMLYFALIQIQRIFVQLPSCPVRPEPESRAICPCLCAIS